MDCNWSSAYYGRTFINSETEYSFKSIYISGIFILIYGLLMFIHNNARLKIPVVLMLAFSVSIIECTLNMDATGIGTTSRTSYLLDYDAVKTVTKPYLIMTHPSIEWISFWSAF